MLSNTSKAVGEYIVRHGMFAVASYCDFQLVSQNFRYSKKFKLKAKKMKPVCFLFLVLQSFLHCNIRAEYRPLKPHRDISRYGKCISQCVLNISYKQESQFSISY